MNALDYQWNLREVMARNGIFSTTKLIPLLNERGIHLSGSQVYRLAAERPERLNLLVLVTLMDILNCTADDLITPLSLGAAQTADRAEAGSSSAIAVLKEQGFRPKRADIPPSAGA